jgi:HTH-type transcriptional regulator / antitoxin HigA
LERVDRLIAGRMAITEDVAEVLAKFLGGSRIFWLSREEQYRGDIGHLQAKGNLSAARAWLSELPVRDMKKFGWIKIADNDLRSNLDACLQFFAVSNVNDWREKYHWIMSAVSFRTSLSFESQPGPVLTWLRYGELQASEIECAPGGSVGQRESLLRV